MKKRAAKTVIYGSRNERVAIGIRETAPDSQSCPLTLSIRMSPEFRGRLAIRDGGGTIVIQCKDQSSKDALLFALQEIFFQRDLDDRRWEKGEETHS